MVKIIIIKLDLFVDLFKSFKESLNSYNALLSVPAGVKVIILILSLDYFFNFSFSFFFIKKFRINKLENFIKGIFSRAGKHQYKDKNFLK